MLANYKEATPEQLEKTTGFDGKFVIPVGTKISFTGTEKVYVEESATLKNQKGEPAVTTFFGWEKDGKDILVTTGCLSRNRVPAGGNVTRTEGSVPANSAPCFNGVKKTGEIAEALKGNSYELVAKQSYTVYSQALKQMVNGTAYHWSKI